MQKTITFSAHKDVTDPPMDGVALSFPFSVVDSDLSGSPEEKSSTHNHRVIVSITRTRRIGWQLSDDDLPKVLFEYGKRFVKKTIESDSLPGDFTIKMPIITDISHPGACRFEVSLVPMPDGVIEKVDLPRIIEGFRQ